MMKIQALVSGAALVAVFALGYAGCGSDEPGKPKTPASSCGDGTCDTGEDASNCEADCGTCGNGTCDAAENFATCADDCTMCDDLCAQSATCTGQMNCTGITMDPAGCVSNCLANAPSQQQYDLQMGLTCDEVNASACAVQVDLQAACTCPSLGTCPAGQTCLPTSGDPVCIDSTTGTAPAGAASCASAADCATGESCIAFSANATSGFCLGACQ